MLLIISSIINIMTTYIENNQIDNIRVIHELNVDNLESGTHKFWFRVASNALGQWQHIPIWVFKGISSGKKIMITAAVHGDEYNGTLTAHDIARKLNHVALTGTVIIIPTVNLSGMLHHSRHFFSSDPDVSDGNLNQLFPGNINGNEPQRYLANLWENILKNNADLAIDLHTQTTGSVYPLYLFADFRIPEALNMARLMNPDAILNDPGEAGVLETVWNQHGVPSITVEIGIGRYTDHKLVSRASEGVMNILQYHNVIQGGTKAIIKTIESDSVTSIRAIMGGFVLPTVQLLQKVEQGQIVAIHYDCFGEIQHEYKAPCSGIVLSHNVESMRAEGSLIVRLIH